jgi:Tol biopolymer transport system component
MASQTTTRTSGTVSGPKRAVLAGLALLAASVALVGSTAREAEAAVSEKIVFASTRTTGKGVVNPTGDREIFRMNSNGTGARQLTYNTGHDGEPTLSPDGTKIAYMSRGDQASNPEGDWEIYVMSALDGSGNRHLTDNGANVDDLVPVFSPDAQQIAYLSTGVQSSNPQGDYEIYRMNASDGSSKKNLSNNDAEYDESPEWGR